MKNVTLSFDNGPCPDVTDAVLDVLKDYGLLSTFFVVGERLAKPDMREVVERASAEGHWIGNHTFTHGKPLGVRSRDEMEYEIGATQDLLGSLVHRERWFRPNGDGGNLDRRLLSSDTIAYLKQHGYSCVLWNAVPGDWRDPQGWVDTALAQCDAEEWPLLVLHDIPVGAMPQLPRLLDSLLRRGVAFKQDFPEDMVPIRRGDQVLDLEHLTALAEVR